MIKLNKITFLILLSLCILLLSGCKTTIEPEIYISEILEFEKIQYIDAVLKLEIISKNTYQENKEKITSILRSYLGEIDNVRYEEKELSGFYVCDIQIPVEEYEFLEEYSDNFLTLAVSKEEKVYTAYLIFNKDIFEGLNNEISSEFFQTFDLNDMNINITLINDLKEDVFLELQGVYINGKSYPFLEKYILQRKKRITIAFSNVLKDFMIENREVSFVKLILKF